MNSQGEAGQANDISRNGSRPSKVSSLILIIIYIVVIFLFFEKLNKQFIEGKLVKFFKLLQQNVFLLHFVAQMMFY